MTRRWRAAMRALFPAVLVAALAAGTAVADGGEGRKAAGEKKQYRSSEPVRDRDRAERRDAKERDAKRKHERERRFRDDERAIVRDFYSRNPAALPPGLARRGGELPPGLARRGGPLPPGLSRGQPLTAEIEVHLLPLPRELELKLPPPPHEVLRRSIGRDLVLIDRHNRRVLDVMKDALP